MRGGRKINMPVNYSDILAFPKADLHRHMDDVNPKILIKFADKVNLPASSVEELSQIYSFRDKEGKSRTLDEVFKRFAWSIAAMRTPEGLEEIAYQQVLDLKKENILYAELRFAPGYHSIYPAPFYKPEIYEKNPDKPMKLQETVESALKGIKRGMKDTGIVVNLTLSIPRESHIRYSLKSAFEIACLAIKLQEEGVIAIGLDCNERDFPPEIYESVFMSTIYSKIKRDPHAGEMGKTIFQKIKNIETSIYNLRADGIPHALPLYMDQKLMDAVKSKNIRIARNPWEDPVIRGTEDDGTDILFENGIKISLCSDDPNLMKQTLSQGFEKVLNKYNWEEEQMQKLVANGVNTGFYINNKQKKRVQEMFVKNGLSRSLLE